VPAQAFFSQHTPLLAAPHGSVSASTALFPPLSSLQLCGGDAHHPTLLQHAVIPSGSAVLLFLQGSLSVCFGFDFLFCFSCFLSPRFSGTTQVITVSYVIYCDNM
jgi:hypothetical protein